MSAATDWEHWDIDEPTLARKFEAVQRKTVTRRRAIPNVLRATFWSPRPALNPPGFSGS